VQSLRPLLLSSSQLQNLANLDCLHLQLFSSN
jgi:hypothetical protein